MNTVKNALLHLLKKIDVKAPLKKEVKEAIITLNNFPDEPKKEQAGDFFYRFIRKDPTLLLNKNNEKVLNNFLHQTALLDDTTNKTLIVFRTYLEKLGFGKPSKDETISYKNHHGKF